MKKVFTSVLVIGFLSISMSAMSKDKDFSLSFGKTEAETVNFELLNAKDVSVAIYSDVYGELLSEELNSDKNIAKSYNFKNLDSGIYYLVIESPQKIEKYKIKVDSDKKVLIENEPVSEVFKPEFLVNGNRVKVHLSGVKNAAKISVTDFQDTLYYNATKKALNGEVELTFDLSKKTADQYIITVEENGKVFNKIVSVR
ncbi:hypothetical protein [Chryseobacterium luquanense]|uniref:Por secretion system C-terminal sorting domain-containing protein n=1 Tax=Chryseobacterium luquanense TaxID=2983766 RepID=A0ABT3Y259_9FLAO|nr:hypothetical protein [Chryseobacterium luquanense]MCX8532220.1 hypothetical protein [Chryseobacterium luquanense]